MPSEVVRQTRVPAYLIGGLMFLIPLTEIAVSGWPYRIHDPEWRVGLINTAANASTAVLLALLIVFLVGVFAEDRLTSWLVAIVSAVMVLFCVGGSGSFVLDALQLRAQVPPNLEGRYNLSSGWAFAKIFLAALGALVLSINAFRNARSMRRAHSRRGKNARAVLVSSSPPAGGGPTSKPTAGLTQILSTPANTTVTSRTES